MPSYFSSWSMGPAGSVSAAVSTTGGGSGLPELIAKMLVVKLISVAGGLPRSWLGMNSWTVPVTQTSLPTTAAAGGAAEVNTNTPSDVAGSPSPGASIWMKKPLVFTPVTMPFVVTLVPASSDSSPLPWICAIVFVVLHARVESTASWNSFCAMFAPLSVTCIVNVNRSEEHTSELQSHSDLVCRLLLEKKKEQP